MKKAHHKKTIIVSFHLDEVSIVAKFIETESKIVVAGLGEEKTGSCLMGIVSVGGRRKSSGGWLYNSVNIFNTA